jgi:hypothetical protein
VFAAMAGTWRERLERRITDRGRNSFGVLLIMLLVNFVVGGLDDSVPVRIISALLYLATIVVAATIVHFPPWLPRRIAGGVVVVLVTASIALAPVEKATARGFTSICATLINLVVLLAVLDQIFTEEQVQIQTIAGAFCSYLLIGTAFSTLYAAFDYLGTGNFFNQTMSPPDYGYFSFTTLTTVGFGDITIISNFGRRMAMVEAVGGQLFLATVVAQLVSNFRGGRRRALLGPQEAAAAASGAEGEAPNRLPPSATDDPSSD